MPIAGLGAAEFLAHAGAVTPANPSTGPETPAKVRDAAKQFESFVIAQMLRGMRDGGSSWMGTGGDEDPSGDTAMGLAEEQFAKALSAGGGLGLARLVEAGLNPANAPQRKAAAQKLAE